MSQSEPFIVIDNKQDTVPDPKTIVQECHSVRKTQSRVEKAIPGVALVDDSGKTYCWVKYGGAVTMGEARTQDFVWRTLNTNADANSTHPAVRVPRVYLAFQLGYSGYIVMEHIEGETCDTSDSDVSLVAAAVEALIAIRSPTPVPGPIGGGTIFHRFFLHWESPVAYDSIAELQDHVNGILAFVGRPLRVDFEPEVAEHGLPLCPCDMNPKNFIKDRSGQIVAIDFGATCFLPTSFFAFALLLGDHFTHLISQKIEYPASPQLNALLGASYALVPFGKNTVGLKKSSRNAKIMSSSSSIKRDHDR
ncbi:hypothetical protein BDN70DRAFT_853589 [Pholiota conissans]|uniref:Aminoglycoside phosphotransferase domain-containing protein n=1 Tax=Pholiota conissans TaxID=109636 RepID=A0A9P5Z8W3_9AGAR|nr:hypothetical protein BDN70DRAFT_853589 [Pholiota conissans]